MPGAQTNVPPDPDGQRAFDVAAAATWARSWLFDAALPLWWQVGADRRDGGFFERIDMTGRALPLPKRVRVQARQIFVYAAAGRLGWHGPWREAVGHGLSHLLDRYRRSDGLFAVTPDKADAERASGADLYDQAFVLLALASAWNAMDRPEELLSEATTLLATLEHALGHESGGFRECNAELTLLANPHMHLLEALLAWVQLGQRGPFERFARQIVDLAYRRMIYPSIGAIGEHFSVEWERRAPADAICEPGHQFEWAYLLRLSERLLHLDLGEAIVGLERFGSRHGLDGDRIIFSTDAHGKALDRSSRLWAQTEALRSYAISTDLAGTAHRQLGRRFEQVKRFIDAAPLTGAWRERIGADGQWLDEPAPASSLYHLMTGFAPLLAAGDDPLLATI